MSDIKSNTISDLLPDFNSVQARRHRSWRHIKDITTRYLMATGGISVIIAIVLIAFYLLYVVLPMFRPATMERTATYHLVGEPADQTAYYAMEEQHEIGLRATDSGSLYFFRTKDGTLVDEYRLFKDQDDRISAFSAGDPSQALLAYGTNDGKALFVEHKYKVTYPNDIRLITPYLSYPLGEAPVTIDPDGARIEKITAQSDEEQTTIAALTEDARLIIASFTKQTSFLDDEVKIDRKESTIPVTNRITHLLLDVEQRELYLADDKGNISYYDVSDKTSPRLVQRVHAVPEGIDITSLKFLSGGISILVGDSRGWITQWFPVRDDENNYTLENVRHFESQVSPIVDLAPEYFRKGFLALDAKGNLGIYHTTAHRTVKIKQVTADNPVLVAISPRANAMLMESGNGKLEYWHINNEYPEISWQSIWGKIWYESRQGPEYIWQSSSASSDFEPKFSLTPLAFGTIKAAFYAMLFAIPLAIFGAMYTAYFMSPRMRSSVKPTIEIMEALPTVILGFLAGLWFAPFVEKYMPGIFMVLLLLPVAVLLSSYLWYRLPEKFHHLVPDGWEAALLIPVILVTVFIALTLSQPVESIFFGGNMPLWISHELGFDFDQRNSLVVGIAMGFAVIPTIFSISEDAIYSVPKHLTTGSLALGATTWQTMVRVVLLTASPGIFSAIMIGLGRAVGETMIVLMATGNTAIMDMNIFQGFRALSANIAVEMPESEVGSTHFRILFLAGLVLFVATFLVNTMAELVRQRLRTKYSSL